MRQLRDDARLALRRLRKQPGFTAVAGLTLALGIGANTAIFTLIHAVMLQPLPVTRPAELYRLGDTLDCCVNSGLSGDTALFSTELFAYLREQLPEFADLAAFQANTSATAIRPPGGETSTSVPASYVSANYFRMFGVAASAGRLLEPADDSAGAPPVMVMSHRTWVERFGADPSLVGQPFLINGVPVVLAGVAARDFFGETIRPNPAGVWLPLGQEPVLRGQTALASRPSANWLYAIGRIPGQVDVSMLSGRATHALQTWLAAQTFLSDRNREDIPEQRIVVTSAAGGVELMRGNFGQSLGVLVVMSGLVLLIAAANLANLLLARADRAQASVRAALGASVGRLVRQSLVEGMVLALIGCAGALVVSVLATRAIVALQFPAEIALPVDVMPSATVVAFSLGLAMATGMFFSAAPAWAMARVNPIDALRGLARDGADVSFMPRRSLVVVQVALSLVLLAGAGLLAESLGNLERQPLGFETDQRVIAFIDPPASLAAEPGRLATVLTTLRQRLEQIPQVEAASYAMYSPMEGNNWSGPIVVSGRPAEPDNSDYSSWNRVGPDYFETLGTRIVLGRGITERDTPASQRVAVVNEAFVRQFLSERDPLGVGLGLSALASHSEDYRIVGVAEDAKFSGANRPVRPMIFMPVMQLAPYGPDEAASAEVQARSTLVRTVALKLRSAGAGLEPAVRRALSDADPALGLTRLMPLDRQVAGNFRRDRLLSWLATSYGVLALLLSAIGLFGVTSYAVNRRVHEIGIRMALGADRRHILWGVTKGALLQVAAGVAIGLPGALWAGGVIAAGLYEIGAHDPFVLGVATSVLIAVALLAAFVPARRAASVDPTQALREQ
jgi:predicted permease